MLLSLLGMQSACSQQAFVSVNADEFESLIAKNDVQLLDVRTAEEFADGHLAGAFNIDIKQGDFDKMATAWLSKQRPVAVYCRSGRRSADAAKRLTVMGYEVTNLSGGIMDWQKNNKPTTTDPAEADRFVTPGGKTVTFYALMHGSVRIDFDGYEIIVDPVARLGNRIVDFSAMPAPHLVIVTHEHRDHFDPATLTQLLSDDATQFITNARCATEFGRGRVMANGDTLTLPNGIKIDAVPAYNTTPEHTQFHPKGRDNGFVLNLDGLRVYIAGDTEDIPEMAALTDIDIAFLPCNQPYTMTAEQLVNAARMVKAKHIFPYHYGTTDVTGIAAQLPDTDVRIRHYE